MTQLEPPIRASYSSLTTYLQCGEKYRLTKIVKLVEVPAWYFVGGSAVHAATEAYDLGTLSTATRLFVECFEKEVEARKADSDVPEEEWLAGGRATKAYPEKQNRDWWLAEGPGMVQAWIDWRKRCGWEIWSPPNGAGPGIEMQLNVEFGGHPILMFVDRVMITPDGQLVVVDIKTGASEPESEVQLGLYACGLERVFDARPQLGAYWMARKGELAQVTDLEHFTPALIGRWVADWSRAVKAGIFIPHPTRLCRTCGVKEYCAAVGGRKAGEL